MVTFHSVWKYDKMSVPATQPTILQVVVCRLTTRTSSDLRRVSG